MRSELAAFGEMASHLANPLVLVGLALLLVFGLHRALIRSRILPPVDRRTSGIIVQSLLRYGFWIAALLIVLGIGYAGYKTHRETQPAIVNAETVSTAIEALTVQLHSKDLREQEYQDQIKALTETVQALAKKQDTPGVKEALAALAHGQTEAAKAIFAKTVEAKAAEGAAANRDAAEAARHLGALAFLENTEEALRWYRRADELDPANADGWNRLGHLYIRTGQLDQAEAAYRKVVTLGEANSDMEGIGIGNLGVIYQTRGELDRAEATLGRFPLCEASSALLVTCPGGDGECLLVGDNEQEKELYLFLVQDQKLNSDAQRGFGLAPQGRQGDFGHRGTRGCG